MTGQGSFERLWKVGSHETESPSIYGSWGKHDLSTVLGERKNRVVGDEMSLSASSPPFSLLPWPRPSCSGRSFFALCVNARWNWPACFQVRV
jgi:hypothetical protein